MGNGYFDKGTAIIGKETVPFVKRMIRDRYVIWAPEGFVEDENLVSRYTYLFSKEKSPLSLAIKFTRAERGDTRDRQISHYFGDGKNMMRLEQGILYRETVTGGKALSIYSLRFAVETEAGVLFGCFNATADDRDQWREVVLEMLRNVEELPGEE